MHNYTDLTDEVALKLIDLARWRTKVDPIPIGHPKSPRELAETTGQTITPEGLGGLEALRIFEEVISTTALSIDHPRYLAFVPCAPTEISILADLVVSAFSMYGGSWLEGSGAVHAENQALRFIADLAGMPPTTGGCFVNGGTIGNLSALHAARTAARSRRTGAQRANWAIVCADSAHSSVRYASEILDVELVVATTNDDGLLTGGAVDAAARATDLDVFAVVATAGTTNLGLVDDLGSIAQVCAARELWFHVDGAYGGAALLAPSVRSLFDGIERADSFVVDPHKWMFAPFDCSALLYRDPELGHNAHTQHASYLESLGEDAEWNPSDFAIHLTRRTRGLPFWFSLATHGTDAYRDAVEATLALTRSTAAMIRNRPELELARDPMLSVVVFRRTGWCEADYDAWSDKLLADGVGLVIPTAHDGEPALRFCIVNPRTTEADIEMVLDSLR